MSVIVTALIGLPVLIAILVVGTNLYVPWINRRRDQQLTDDVQAARRPHLSDSRALRRL